MKVLIIGSGGREHALAWKLSRSSQVKKIYIAPGNAGTASVGENVSIKAEDIHALRSFAIREGIDLTVVGPEVPLTMGITDAFRAEGLRVFGPNRLAAEIEGSKVFSKGLMIKYGIPTAAFGKFDDVDDARAYLERTEPPFVVKADGLAAGKGVIICQTREEAFDAVNFIMVSHAFGESGKKVVIEEFLEGEEASFLAITDGTEVVPLAPAQDHKAIYDGDKGPNTGGMGTYSPAPVVTPELAQEVMEMVMRPTVEAMKAEGRVYRGVLYAGLMIKNGKAKVLEFNCRFGDPETQPILMRLEDDLLDLLMRAADGSLSGVRLNWSNKAAVCVVMAAKGYPGDYEKGHEISGLEEAGKINDVMVFHAGTSLKDGKVVTSGGRVLGVTALGDGIRDAIERAYSAVGKISWEGAYYRRDIGQKALKRPV